MRIARTELHKYPPIPEGPLVVQRVMAVTGSHLPSTQGGGVHPGPAPLDIFAVRAAHVGPEVE